MATNMVEIPELMEPTDGTTLLPGDTGFAPPAPGDESHGTVVDDSVGGSTEDDYVVGFGQGDLIVGFGEGDHIVGGAYDDLVIGGAGEDQLHGGTGDDILRGGTGDDYLHGGEGDDYIHGGEGDDFVYSDSGDNTLIGGDGDDFVQSGTGNDFLIGGDGNDVFAFTNINGGGTGDDRIVDFTLGEDVMLVHKTGDTQFSDLDIAQNGITTVVTFADGSTVTLNNTTASDLTDSDILFTV